MDRIISELSKVRFSDSEELDPESFFDAIKKYYDKSPRHRYSDISKVVYKFNDDRIDILRINLSKLKEVAKEKNENEIANKIDKLIDHADLSEYQRKLIEDVSKETKVLMEGYHSVLIATKEELADAQRELEETKEELTSAQKELEETKRELDTTKKELDKRYVEAEEEIEDLHKDKANIYTQFVTILGIFTAIILGAIGSLELIGSVFTRINEVSTGKLLVFSSLTSLAVIIMLFLLMQWINKIVYRVYPTDKYWDYSFKENVVFYAGIIVMLYMLFVGLLLYGEEPKSTISSWLTNDVFGIVSLIVITIAVLSLILYSLRLLSKKE